MRLRKSSLLGISIAAMFLSTVCLAGDVKEVLRVAHVQVAGPMARVYEFHQALLKHLGAHSRVRLMRWMQFTNRQSAPLSAVNKSGLHILSR